MSTAEADVTGGDMSLFEHLAELRMRIIRGGLAVILGAVVMIVFYEPILEFLIRPYADLCTRRGAEFCGLPANTEPGPDGRITPDLIFLDPVEGISVRLRLSFYGGVVLALPVVLWQLWRFVVPALHKNEKRYALGFVSSSVLLFLSGAAIAFTTLSRALEFLIDFAGEDVIPTFQVAAYVRLVTVMMLAFGAGFVIPVLLVFLQLIGVVQWKTLLGAWRYAIVGTFVVAAAITPSGDPWSLLALALPLIGLYFVAILIGWTVQRRRTDD